MASVALIFKIKALFLIVKYIDTHLVSSKTDKKNAKKKKNIQLNVMAGCVCFFFYSVTMQKVFKK